MNNVSFFEGADVNSVKKADWSPLLLACTKQNITIIKNLLSSGANPFFKNKDGWLSWHVACREGNLDIIKLLVHFIQSNPKECHRIKELCDSSSNNGRKGIHVAGICRFNF